MLKTLVTDTYILLSSNLFTAAAAMPTCCRGLAVVSPFSPATTVKVVTLSRRHFKTGSVSGIVFPFSGRKRPDLLLRSGGRGVACAVRSRFSTAGDDSGGACRPRAEGDGCSSSSGTEGGGRRVAEVLVAAAATVALAVGNRVFHKLALVPMKQYPFFLAQLTTFGYVLVYFYILRIRYRAGIVTDEMFSLPRTPYIVIGFLEALGVTSALAAGSILSGATIPILSQTFLVWQLILSALFLGRRYRINQLIGCFLVAVGVVITVASGSIAGHSLNGTCVFWSLLMTLSFLFQAGDTVLKENIFLNAAKILKGGSVDIFVVNSQVSAYQALFIFLLLPFLSKLWGVPFRLLPQYLKDGAACFLNIGTLNGCEGAPLLPLLFVFTNICFNISLLHLLKVSSAVVSCLVSSFSVPLSVYMFTLPLPYLGRASPLPAGFIAGTAMLVAGLVAYAWNPRTGHLTKAHPQ